MTKETIKGIFDIFTILIIGLLVTSCEQTIYSGKQLDAPVNLIIDRCKEYGECYNSSANYTENIKEMYIKVGAWNLQVYGDTKAKREELVDFYSDKIQGFDIIVLQEIRDSDGSAIKILENMVNEKSNLTYSLYVTSPAGKTTYKEQYAIFYKKNLNLKFRDYNLENFTEFERPPVMIQYKDKNLYFIHTKPYNVVNELIGMEKLMLNNSILAGDLNAGCSYFNRNNNKQVLQDYKWLIKDNQDTTIAITSCAYDRVIANKDVFVESYGIDNIDITSTISDHYIIWYIT